MFDDDGTQPRVADTPLPITRAEVLEAQKSNDFCQTVLSRQSARNDSKFFENGGGLLRRKNPHHPDYTKNCVTSKSETNIAILSSISQVVWSSRTDTHVLNDETTILLASHGC